MIDQLLSCKDVTLADAEKLYLAGKTIWLFPDNDWDDALSTYEPNTFESLSWVGVITNALILSQSLNTKIVFTALEIDIKEVLAI